MTQTKSTKKALFMSMLSMLICITMLIGSTFAWFTDSVTSGNNRITAGNLDVEMYWADGTADPATVEWTDASKDNSPIFDYDLWEPGYAVVRHIKISNVGTLALKYEVRIVADEPVGDLAKVIDVYYIKDGKQVSNRSELTDDIKVGTLAEVLSGSSVANGHISGKTGDDVNSDIATIALKMQETAGNEYQGLSIGGEFDIHLVATQYTEEADSFDNLYDDDAPLADIVVASNEAMNNALAEAQPGDSVGLIAGTYQIPDTLPKGVTLIGSGDETVVEIPYHEGASITVSNDDVTVRDIKFETTEIENKVSQVFEVTGKNFTVEGCTFDCTGTNNTIIQKMGSASNLTIRNCNFIGGLRQIGNCYGTKDSTTTIEGCTFSGGTYGIHFDQMNGSTVYVKDCVISAWSSFGETGGGNVIFEGTQFKDGGSYNCVRSYVNTTFTDCTFENDFWYGASNMTVDLNVNGCKKADGTSITAANVKDILKNTDNKNTTVYVDGSEVEVTFE